MLMENIARFSPAETLLLTEGTKAPLKRFFELTLKDLVLREVLSLRTAYKRMLPTDAEETKFVYLGTGARWGQALKPHEQVFVPASWRQKGEEMQAELLRKIALEQAGGYKGLRQKVMQSAVVKDFFDVGWWAGLWNAVPLTASGRTLQTRLQAWLSTCQTQLRNPDTPQETQAALLKSLGSNVLLLDIPGPVLQYLHEHLTEKVPRRQAVEEVEDDSFFWMNYMLYTEQQARHRELDPDDVPVADAWQDRPLPAGEDTDRGVPDEKGFFGELGDLFADSDSTDSGGSDSGDSGGDSGGDGGGDGGCGGGCGGGD